MQDIFITKINIKEVRNIKDFEINLSETERKHLIITGKNGSGKTSLIAEIKQFLNQIVTGNAGSYNHWLKEISLLETELEARQNHGNFVEIENIKIEIEGLENKLKQFGETQISFNLQGESDKISKVINNQIQKGLFTVKNFEVKHYIEMTEVKTLEKIKTKPFYSIDEKAGADFLQHIVNLQFDKLVAKDEEDTKSVINIESWFENFEKQLRELFDEPKLKLEFNRKKYNFSIIENGKEPYTFNQLSDGYSAILDIVTELIMRMEEHKSKSYDVQGIVLIDEIETHLHVDLQKKILPFLTSFFPKIQFIVTTHSPFVLSSIKNSVICDLENRIVTEDLSGYSYDTIVESYFDSNNYSDEFTNKINEYETLMRKDDLSDIERDKLLDLEMYLESIPKYWAKEFAAKYQQIKLKNIGKRK